MMNDPTDVDPTIGRWVKPQGNTMSIQPITPQEALDLKITMIPDEIIETVNRMIAEKMTKGGSVTLLQKDIVLNAILLFEQRGKPTTANEIYDKHWLDFEPFYEKAGWKVAYDKPAYCESYDANFTFKKV